MTWLEKGQAEAKKVKKTVKKPGKAAKEALKLRKANQDFYDAHNVEPMEVDGQVFRSRLEALWYDELKHCESLVCVECARVPVWIEGPYGKFLSEYKPDLTIETTDGSLVYVELKPNHQLAMTDDRQKRALELNPKYRFVVIGGYPYTKRGVTVRMLTGKNEVVHKYVKVCEVLKLLECECEG